MWLLCHKLAPIRLTATQSLSYQYQNSQNTYLPTILSWHHALTWTVSCFTEVVILQQRLIMYSLIFITEVRWLMLRNPVTTFYLSHCKKFRLDQSNSYFTDLWLKLSITDRIMHIHSTFLLKLFFALHLWKHVSKNVHLHCNKLHCSLKETLLDTDIKNNIKQHMSATSKIFSISWYLLSGKSHCNIYSIHSQYANFSTCMCTTLIT